MLHAITARRVLQQFCPVGDVKDLWLNCAACMTSKEDEKESRGGKKGLPWNRSSDRPPPEPTAGSKTLLFAPLLGSQPHQSLSVNKEQVEITFGLS